METDPFASASDIFSITVAGAMNPAIHHPAWYRAIGALNDSELTLAGAAPDPAVQQTPGTSPSGAALPICTPAFSQFTAGAIRVICINQSWTISTHEKILLVKIRDIATKVFSALGHTPVSAYGLNFSYHRKTRLQDVATRLAEFVEAMSLGFDRFQQTKRAARIAYTTSHAGRDLNISVERSVRGLDSVFVGINAHHPILLPAPPFQQFDLSPLFQDSLEPDMRDAQLCLSHILAAFGGGED
jgi:hypothetical protein